MKSIYLSLALIFLTSCIASTPKTSNEVYLGVKVTEDKFKDQKWLESEIYSGTGGTMVANFPARIFYRALYEKNELQYIQLYTIVAFTSWRFIHSATSEDGVELDFHEIDRSVGSGTVTEHFAISLSKSDLIKMAKKNWQIKYYGKKGDGVEIVPKFLTEGFLKKLNCFSSNSCK